jgi:hypothetical protein
MLKLLLPKGMILSAIQKKELKNYGCCWSTIMRAYTYEEKDAANIEEYLHQKHVAFTCESIPDIDKGKTVQQKTLDTRIDIITDQIYKDKQLLRTELKAFNDEMVLSDLHTIPSVNDYESEFRFKVHLDLHQRYMQLIAAEKELDNLITSQETQETERVVFKRHSMSELLNRPEKKWYVNQLFGAGDLGEIFGASGCGKTFVTIDLILSLCTGRKWAKSFDVNEPLEVAYCAGEGLSGLPARFRSALDNYKIKDLPNFSFFDEMPQFFGESWNNSLQRFVDHCKNIDYRPQVLIIDTFHTATQECDENSTKEAGVVLKACRSAMSQLGCCVIFIHHTNKAGGDRGSTALRAAMDFMLKVECPSAVGRSHRISCDKLKDGEQWSEKLFDLQNDGNSAYVEWNDLTIEEELSLPNKEIFKSNVLQHLRSYPGITFSATDIGNKFNHSRQYCGKILSELHRDNKCSKTTSDPANTKSAKNPWKYFA